MGKFEKVDGEFVQVVNQDQTELTPREAWRATYELNDAEGNKKTWSQFNLSSKIKAFVNGGANFLFAIGIPLKMGVGIIAVLVASFAATTLDSATRLQRYVVQELGGSLGIRPLKNVYIATLFAITLGGAIAMLRGPAPNSPPGTGGLLLWPLFGATNQLLAGLAFMVTAFYLWRRSRPVAIVVLPMLFMVILPAYAMVWQLFDAEYGWFWDFKKFGLVAVIGLITLGLQVWLVVEAVIVWPKVKGVLEEPPEEGDLECAANRIGGPPC